MSDRNVTAGNNEGSGCFPLCWIPIVMTITTFLLGIVCLFFMSIGGLVLGVLHCTLGVILCIVPYAANKYPAKPKATAAVICTSLYIVLLLCTFGYTGWLMKQNIRAEIELDDDHLRPFINPTFQKYASKSGLNPNLRRLEGVEDATNGSALHRSEESMMETEERQDLLSLQHGLPVRIIDPSASLNTEDAIDGTAKRDSEVNEQAQLFDEYQYLPPYSPIESNEKLLSGNTAYRSFHSAEQQLKQKLTEQSSSLNTQVLRQGTGCVSGFEFTKKDMECLQRLNSSSGNPEEADRRAEALLDWGLFCGYTEYSLAAFRKWPVSCSKVCHFDKLAFYKYRKSTDSFLKHVRELGDAVDSISPTDAGLCTLLGLVTTCHIHDRSFSHVVLGTLILSLLICIILFGFGIEVLKEDVDLLSKSGEVNS